MIPTKIPKHTTDAVPAPSPGARVPSQRGEIRKARVNHLNAKDRSGEEFKCVSIFLAPQGSLDVALGGGSGKGGDKKSTTKHTWPLAMRRYTLYGCSGT